MKEMMELVSFLNEASHKYYVNGSSPMSDAEFDREYARLEELEEKTGVILHNSPTHRVGTNVPGDNKREHKQRMLSLSKINSDAGIKKFLDDMAKANDGKLPDISAELKFDGISAELIYRNGILTDAITRGNGEVGNSIYYHVEQMDSVPKRLSQPLDIDVRGEIVASLNSMNQYNLMNPNHPVKNARNATAGAIASIEYGLVKDLGLNFVAYDVGYHAVPLATKNDLLKLFKENNFNIGKYHFGVSDYEDAINVPPVIESIRDKLDFLIDGVVYKVCDFKLRESLGETERNPRWATAFKFKSKGEWTKLTDVTWEVSKSGKLTPVAHFNPIEITGSKLSRATLNSWNFIVALGIKINDDIFVEKSNDIIPKIAQLSHAIDSSEIVPPKRCPVCDALLYAEGNDLVCKNEYCRPRVIAALTHFCSVNCMDIRTIGEKTIAQMYDKLGITRPYQLFEVRDDELKNVLEFSPRKIKHFREEIHLCKGKPLRNILFALNIDGVGRTAAKNIAAKFLGFDILMQASLGDIKKTYGVSEATATSLYKYLKNNDEMKKLRPYIE